MRKRSAKRMIADALAAGGRCTIWIDDADGEMPDDRDMFKVGADGIEFRPTLASLIEMHSRNEFESFDDDTFQLMHEHLMELVGVIRSSGCKTAAEFRDWRQRRN